MFAAVARFCIRHRWSVIGVYALALPLSLFFGIPVFKHLKAGGFEDRGAESWSVKEDLEKKIKVGGGDLIAIYTATSGTIDDVEGFGAVLSAITRVEKDEGVVSMVSYYQTGAMQFVNADKTKTFVFITLNGDDQQKIDTYHRITPLLEAKPFTLQLGGLYPVQEQLQDIIAADLFRAESIAFPITAVMLLLIFGSVASASLPMILGLMSIAFALVTLRVILVFTDVSLFAVNIITLLGLGLAIDYSLFLVNRYREELHKHTPEDALVRAMTTTGRAVAFSGVTVAASLLGLFVFPQMFLRSMAIGGIAVVMLTLMLSLTLLPALLAALGKNIDALHLPFIRRLEEAPNADGFWHRMATGVMKRPFIVATAVVVPLLMLGAPFLRFDPSMPDYRILPPDTTAYQANEVLDREFIGKQMTPIDVLVTTTGPALSPENLSALYDLGERFTKLENVRAVSGLFTLVPGVSKEKLIETLSKQKAEQDPQIQMGIDAFSAGDAFRFGLYSDLTFNDAGALKLVEELRMMEEPPGMRITVGGAGAFLYELKANLRARAPLMIGIVCLVMFVVLFLVFGSVTIPIKAMIMNSLSITASFGAIVWIFQDGRFEGLLQYESLGISDTSQPVLMFAVVFGLSMDYEVLLLARVREEYLKTGDNTIAVARGLARTGRLITSAAALLVVVIGAFGTSHIVFMKALGVGMALAIAIDATIIRALLVPATMKMMGKWNWWAPRPLMRLVEMAGLNDLEGHGDEEPATPPIATKPAAE